MQMLPQEFDATQFDPNFSGGGQLPVGRQPIVIYGHEVKANKSGDGGYLELKVRVIDGPGAGSIGSIRPNLYHSNPVVVDIANKQMSAICHVIGVYKLTDPTVLYNKPFSVEVAPQSDPKYTQVVGVYDMNGNEPKKVSAATGQQSAPATQAWAGQPAQQAAQPAQQNAPVAAWGSAPAANAAPAAQAAPANASPWGRPAGG